MTKLPISYYIDWTGLEDFDYNFDDQGLPRYDYGYDIGLKYNAITISQWGLFNLQEWDKTGQDTYKQQALRCAAWLVDNVQPWKHDSLAWVYDYGFDLYGPYPPWISGMGQGEATSLLLRCAQVETRPEFERVAHAAIKVFDFSFSDGGVTDILPNGSIFFQEYPTRQPVHVLNGGIFALFGVYDYAQFFADTKYRTLALKCVDTLKNNWGEWDSGFWTYYDLYSIKRLASKMYQELHVREFRALADIFQIDEFNRIADRWERMLNSPVCRVRWTAGKVVEKVRLKLHK